ncbi:MAG: alkaline phosphatase family protein, partial [Lactimicrobium massiliense]
KTLPVTTILDQLAKAQICADSIWPMFGHNPCASLHEQCLLAAKLSHQSDLRFLYVYWDGFDSWLHEHGPSHPDTGRQLAMINDDILVLEKMVDEDTGVLVIADHGQIDCTIYEMQKDPELMAMFRHMPALEARACAFYIRPGLEKSFEDLFHTRFGGKFLLLRKEKILSREIFGPGIPHLRLPEFIGDYLAIARTPLCLTAKTSHFHGQHAGAMADEAMIPVILSGESV